MVFIEVNYEYWPNGTHAGLKQVLLTPELILGRFVIAQRQALIIVAGYQFERSRNDVEKYSTFPRRRAAIRLHRAKQRH
jgi:hypothetical protein